MLKYPNTNCARAPVPARDAILKHSLRPGRGLGSWQWDVASMGRAEPGSSAAPSFRAPRHRGPQKIRAPQTHGAQGRQVAQLWGRGRD